MSTNTVGTTELIDNIAKSKEGIADILKSADESAKSEMKNKEKKMKEKEDKEKESTKPPLEKGESVMEKLKSAAEQISKMEHHKHVTGDPSSKEYCAGDPSLQGSQGSTIPEAGSTNNKSDTQGGMIEAVQGQLRKAAEVLTLVVEEQSVQGKKLSTLIEALSKGAEAPLQKNAGTTDNTEAPDSEDFKETPNEGMKEKVKEAAASRGNEELNKEAASVSEPRFKESEGLPSGYGATTFSITNTSHKKELISKMNDYIAGKPAEIQNAKNPYKDDIQTFMYGTINYDTVASINKCLSRLYGDNSIKVIL